MGQWTKKEFERSWTPGRYILCKCSEETMDHVLVYCPLSKDVWNELLKLFLEQTNGISKILLIFFFNGYLINLKNLSRFFLALWFLKNSMIFQGTELNTAQKTHKIQSSIKGS